MVGHLYQNHKITQIAFRNTMVHERTTCDNVSSTLFNDLNLICILFEKKNVIVMFTFSAINYLL